MNISQNVLTRYTNLNKRVYVLESQYSELKQALRVAVAASDAHNKEKALAALNLWNKEHKELTGKVARMAAKHGAVDKVELERAQYNLSLKYPRDGIGRLHLNDDADYYTYVSGCGFDKVGTVFGKWLNTRCGEYFQLLNDIQIEQLGYGISRGRDGVVRVDGGCGLSCMIAISEQIGLNVKQTNHVGRSRTFCNGFIVTGLE